MNTTENNKLIAEFMGYKVETDLYGGIPVNGMKTITVRTDSLKFHSDWNWLMEVVEKIEATEDPTQKGVFASVEINKKYTRINCYYCRNRNYYNVTKNGSKIEATYNACIAFINWYNEQK